MIQAMEDQLDSRFLSYVRGSWPAGLRLVSEAHVKPLLAAKIAA